MNGKIASIKAHRSKELMKKSRFKLENGYIIVQKKAKASRKFTELFENRFRFIDDIFYPKQQQQQQKQRNCLSMLRPTFPAHRSMQS